MTRRVVSIIEVETEANKAHATCTRVLKPSSTFTIIYLSYNTYNGQRRRWSIQVLFSTSCPRCRLIDGSSYSLTVFSPSGKLVQIEHALAAVAQGTTSLGIKGPFALFSFNMRPLNNSLATNGIVIATEKKTSSILIDDSVIEKVATICPNIGIVYSGMGPDFRILVTKARKSAQAYWKIYGEYPPTRVLTQEIATVMQQATQSG